MSAWRDSLGSIIISHGIPALAGELWVRHTSVYPPFCTEESRSGVSLRAISTYERIRSLSAFAAQVQNLSDGTSVQIEITP